MTLFFSTTIIVLITFMAFIINIGMFVKAKINLQNAVDAAAWSGAAVQSRQLTNIAYMNWELRNVYKEWMFKYYILGNLSIKDISGNPTSDLVSFRMNSLANISPDKKDKYNFPSVCINFKGQTANGAPDLCQTYSVPGFPKFGDLGVSGIDDTATAFKNSLEELKNEACAQRSVMNYTASLMWAYSLADNSGLSGSQIGDGVPEILQSRDGAFPKAFEIAMRIRSLESFVNKKPYAEGVCQNESVAAGQGCTSIQAVVDQQTPSNERIIKSFYAGFRNIGYGASDELKQSFTLTELAPNVYTDDQAFSLSNLLIPQEAVDAREKSYLDLLIQTVNLAPLYTAFTVTTGTGPGYDTTAECDATKIAIPVPGYPLGFVKNPDVLTYYAVKGEANWVGLFNPFSNQSIKITAYAAAKPFGGRIGPSIFDTKKGVELTARQGNGKFKSSAYIVGFDYNAGDLSGKDYLAGAPLPLSDFWLNSPTQIVGGWAAPTQIAFSVPNLPYDFISDSQKDVTGHTADSEKIDVMVPDPSVNSISSGLYKSSILKKFKANLQGGTDSNSVQQAILDARAPTLFDAANYLIPTPEDLNQELGVSAYGTVIDRPEGGGVNDRHYIMRIFAPLFSPNIPDALYKDRGSIETIFRDYIENQEKAVEKYRDAINAAAIAISQQRSGSGSTTTAIKAAEYFSDLPDFGSGTPNVKGKPTCNSILGQFLHYYTAPHKQDSFVSGGGAGCPEPLQEMILKAWESDANKYGDYYSTDYIASPTLKEELFSAYRPSKFHDTDESGVWKRSIARSVNEKMIRNYYSTKLISLKSVIRNGHYDAPRRNFTILSEGNTAHDLLEDVKTSAFKNALDLSSEGDLVENISH